MLTSLSTSTGSRVSRSRTWVTVCFHLGRSSQTGFQVTAEIFADQRVLQAKLPEIFRAQVPEQTILFSLGEIILQHPMEIDLMTKNLAL